MAWREVSREDGSLKGIEGVWLDEKDQHTQFLSKYIWKINIPSKALCTHCNSLLNYSSGGKKDIRKHCKNKKTCPNGKLYVLIMSRMRFRVNLHSIFA